MHRLAFLVYFREKLEGNSSLENCKVFLYGLRLDLSITGYIFIIPLLLYITFSFLNRHKLPLGFLKIYQIVFVVLFSIITIIDLQIYHAWGTKVNEKVFSYAFKFPKEAMASSASSPVLLLSFILIALLAISLFLFREFYKQPILIPKYNKKIHALVGIVLLSLTFLCIRGGLGVAPNNQSMAYFSTHQILNHAAVNTEWNLLSSFFASKKTKKNPYNYFKQEKAENYFKALYTVQKDTSLNILNSPKPNIVLVIMESFSANLTHKYGKLQGVTPYFDSLLQTGYSFDNIYAAGNRTDKGLIGTLAGYPTLAAGSIVKWPEKMQKIPAISQKLKKVGYSNSFFYGGELEFDNYKAFLLSHDYDYLVDKNVFPKKDMNSKWGAYDGLVLNHQLRYLNNEKSPFFSTILTLTHHEPFEVPGDYKFGKSDDLNKFKSTAYYTDSVLNNFLSNAKKQSWYANTLFIFIADHGHYYPKAKEEIYEAGRYHIPMLFYGEVIKPEYRGRSNSKIGSQQDLAATLLAQLGISHKDFIYSKNLLNPFSKEFAFYTWDNGLGFITPNNYLAFDNVGKSILIDGGKENLNIGQSYLQIVYQNFINL